MSLCLTPPLPHPLPPSYLISQASMLFSRTAPLETPPRQTSYSRRWSTRVWPRHTSRMVKGTACPGPAMQCPVCRWPRRWWATWRRSRGWTAPCRPWRYMTRRRATSRDTSLERWACHRSRFEFSLFMCSMFSRKLCESRNYQPTGSWPDLPSLKIQNV